MKSWELLSWSSTYVGTRFEVSWLAIQYFPANQSAPNQQSVILFKEILYGRFKDQNLPLEKNSSLDLR